MLRFLLTKKWKHPDSGAEGVDYETLDADVPLLQRALHCGGFGDNAYEYHNLFGVEVLNPGVYPQEGRSEPVDMARANEMITHWSDEAAKNGAALEDMRAQRDAADREAQISAQSNRELLAEIERLRAATMDTDTLLTNIKTKADNCYCDYIRLCEVTACKGWEAKIEAGKFGKAELDAHHEAWQKYGEHKALIHIGDYIKHLNLMPGAIPVSIVRFEEVQKDLRECEWKLGKAREEITELRVERAVRDAKEKADNAAKVSIPFLHA
jgi:hypothetical protein